MSLVIDVDGAAVGSASPFDFDLFARQAEAGISLKRSARGHGLGTLAIIQLVEFRSSPWQSGHNLCVEVRVRR